MKTNAILTVFAAGLLAACCSNTGTTKESALPKFTFRWILMRFSRLRRLWDIES
ncbi:MAG: hypothetical protein MUC60_19415 [Oscillatoria sp. Prado101]|jgi:hypothetical protein|nr:hypothetical protein [Oscillatoria sp. Prado101]